MLKNTLSIFFTILFMATTMAPTLLVIIDDSVDISVFYDFSEEEEEGKEKDNLESFFADNTIELSSLVKKEKKKNVEYFFKNYPKPQLNLILPPPENDIF